MIIYLDIETLPTDDEALIAEFASSITAPAQYKKPESIDAWLSENKASAISEKIAKTSFDGLYGRICCIGYAFDNGEVFTSAGNDEGKVIADFYSHVYDLTTVNIRGQLSDRSATVCGHNLVGFDLPFLKHRSLILGIKPPSVILKAMHAKPWSSEVFDTMLEWSSDRENRISMDKLCRAFGIPGKGNFDGSMVAQTWPTNPQKVIDYCKDDVSKTRKIHNRYFFIQE
jgi:DNA polymerase elongation subunit (family B)